MADRPTLWSTRLGLVPYAEATELQLGIAAARREGGVPDTLLLLEHPPVLTKGRRTDPRELGMGEDWYRMQGIEIADSDRGGRVTYHGPGQLVAYPIVDLAQLDGGGNGGATDVHAYVATLERVMIGALAQYGVPAQIFDGLTGVWTVGRPPVPIGSPGPEGTTVAARSPELAAVDGEARKIGSIGIHVSRGVTTHGLAINVNNDLQPFEWVVPCGIEAARMTSVASERGAEQDFQAFAGTVEQSMARELSRELIEVTPTTLESSIAAARIPN
jgi:lipoyl(octanoyl) transferase